MLETAHETYDSYQIEQNLIDFIIEKVITMREIPYMKLENSIEQSKHQQSIRSVVKQIKQGGFASKPSNRRGMDVDLKSIKQTVPYEGGEFNQSRAG